VELLCKLRDRSIRTPELLQNAASSGVRERGKGGIKTNCRKLNHVVQFLARGSASGNGAEIGRHARRLSAHVGKAKAVTATDRKIAGCFYNTLRHGMEYRNPGASYCQESNRQRVLTNLARRAKSLGYTRQPTPTPG
jgi:hypothetical protein